ncbi:WD40-repeat-containing domain protein [Fomitopsis serialis]|uniref:WD40-repeat-containing domain protein n=1 Tax=Fomitopsis serialis TaxID=139415 RepID=UPI002008E7FA|nr:WD40-repeat-containing domain protein [Neoantrodia serialis]KAH9924803.1 WD40-repeat-containing domain protein [Neoantrodia serialis]
MVSTAYVPTLTLTGGHSDTVNALAFSPDCKYLASGGDDGAVVIWDVRSGDLIYRFTVDGQVDSLLWHPIQTETIIIGCNSGSIRQLRYFSAISSEVYEIDLGRQPNIVYSMDYSAATSCLAASVGLDVLIAKETTPNKYSVIIPLPHPQEGAHPAPDNAVALKFDKDGRTLVATYSSRGIICWDVHARHPLWRIAPPEAYPSMGHSAINQTSRFIAVHNGSDGVHLYSLGGHDQKPRRLYKFADTQPLPRIAVQVSFIHGDQAIVCGTSSGNVCIWQTKSGELFQSLGHRDDIIMAVAGCQRGNVCYLATGSATRGPDTYIKIWRARIDGIGLQQVPESFFQGFIRGLSSDSDRLIPTVEELQAVFRTIVVLTISLGLCWALLKVGSVVPWADCGRTMLHAVYLAQHALGRCWIWGLDMATGAYLVGKRVVCQMVVVASEWARAQALRALGLPLDIMDRLPPPQ